MEETSAPNAAVSDIDLSNLTNAIVKIFTIILLGYVAGRIGVISKVHAAGIGRFASKFCLPALIFRNLCRLQFTRVNWTFVLGIFLAKLSLFALVIVSTLAIKRPFDLGLAGIFAIFTIQSSDFAFGYPIVDAIYSKIHPEYAEYIYLVAPISLALLNPIGFILMEFQNTINAREQGESKGFCKALLKVLKEIALNPIVNMTVAGIIFNFILSSSIPEILDGIFKVLAEGFSACALFFLGLSLVGKVQGSIGIGLLVPLLLVAAKSLLLPLFAWGILQRLDHSENATSISMFGFLYGTVPTTPSLCIFAADFGFGQDTIATSLVLGYAVAAPLTFVSAKMMTVYVDKAQDFKKLLYDTSFDLSIVSIICCFWVIILFVFNGKWKRIPHRFTMAYMMSIVIACIGIFVFHIHGASDGWHSYPGMVLLMVGVLSSRFWIAILTLVLCILHVRSLSTVLRFQTWLFFAGFGLPMIMTGLQFILAHQEVEYEINPSFHYGKCQAIFSLSAMIVSLGVTVASLVWWQRQNRHHHTIESRALHQQTSSGSIMNSISVENRNRDVQIQPMSRGGFEDESCLPESKTEESASDTRSPSGFFDESTPIMWHFQGAQRQASLVTLSHFEGDDTTEDTFRTNSPMSDENPNQIADENEDEVTEYQSTRHLILILPLIFSMFVGVILCTWKLFKGTATGTLVEIEFLDVALNYGQGVLVALVFGFESGINLILSPMLRRIRRVLTVSKIAVLPRVSELDQSTIQTCNQFTRYHLDGCYEEVVRDRRTNGRIQNKVFTGAALCDYLIRCGLAVDRSGAVEYGTHLLLGRVITNADKEQNFHDALLYYRFLKSYSELS
ncbi:integral membrane protein GPR155 [Elysia marginata]|uniref:Integral membrane protein GPR155 n=1 Tax=Elysia marginata TaxID=1093978 RepID=A0AAV4F7G6_9GAST|nr:integral membrane protein GPR155 [Elysia marginata]